MDEDIKAKWLAIGERIHAAGSVKFTQVLDGLRQVAEAQEVLAAFDWQLPFRGRPRKRYLA